MKDWTMVSRYSVEVHANVDVDSPTNRAYVVEITDGEGDVISDGVASTFKKALIEAFNVYQD
jgi:hypothetical protein